MRIEIYLMTYTTIETCQKNKQKYVVNRKKEREMNH